MCHPLQQFLFCPKCGSRAFVVNNSKSKRCEQCGFTYYFNPAAATVALIERPTRSFTPLSSVTPGEGFGRKGAFEWLCVRRAKEPAKGTLDLPGGFSDCFESSEDSVRREVLEETGLHVLDTQFLFSIPNLYPYSGFVVHTIDMFYRCRIDGDTRTAQAADDAAELLWIRPEEIRPEDFGLMSIRKGVQKLLAMFNHQN